MFRHLTLDVTHCCDSHCTYCYQIHSQKTMTWQTAHLALELFLSFSAENVGIDFYGGEPLLVWPLLMESITYARNRCQQLGKRVVFAMTTNGLLLDEDRCKFMAENDVSLCVSCDGNKTAHEAGRGIDTFEKVWTAYEMAFRYLGRRIEINCTVAPQNVRYFSDAFEFFLKQKVPRVHFAFDTENPWTDDELSELEVQLELSFHLAMRYYENSGRLPYDLFKITPPRKKPSSCVPTKNRFAVSPNGWVYGCMMLIPNNKQAIKNGTLKNFRALCWGHLQELCSHNKAGLKTPPLPFGPFSMERYQTPQHSCSSCNFLLRCSVCPVIPLAYSENVFIIPEYACRINRMKLGFEDRVYEAIYKRRPELVWDVVKRH